MIISPEKKRTCDWLSAQTAEKKTLKILGYFAYNIKLIETEFAFELIEKYPYFNLSLIFSLYNCCYLTDYTFPYGL
jgi:hypothetical protein